MKRIGLVAEYNPFHSGHAYQVAQIKEAYPDGALMVAMSGNVVQRGEFALLDKWKRAKLAVQAGVDLVIELPLLASLQSADYFAKWSVDILGRLGIDVLAFGTETATKSEILDLAVWLQDHQEELNQGIQAYLGQGLSYPASMQAALDDYDEKPVDSFDFRLANNLLGLKYYQAGRSLGYDLDILPIPRKRDFASGSQIRERLRQGLGCSKLVPIQTGQVLDQSQLSFLGDYYDLIKLQVLTKTPEDLRQIQGVREGIEHLILAQCQVSPNLETLLDRLTSRRWTKSAIQRILLAILLNIRQSEWETYQADFEDLALVRVLAYNRKGQEILKQERKNSSIEVFSNLRQDLIQAYELILRGDRVYGLPYPSMDEQNIGRYPLKY